MGKKLLSPDVESGYTGDHRIKSSSFSVCLKFFNKKGRKAYTSIHKSFDFSRIQMNTETDHWNRELGYNHNTDMILKTLLHCLGYRTTF